MAWGGFSEQGQKELVFIDGKPECWAIRQWSIGTSRLATSEPREASSSWWTDIARPHLALSPGQRWQTLHHDDGRRQVKRRHTEPYKDCCVWENQTRTRRKSNGLGRDQWTGAEGTGFHQWKPEHWAIRQWSIGTSCLAISETREPVHLDWRQCSPSSSIVSITTTADVEWRECIQDGTRTDVCGESNKDKKEE